MSLKEKFEAVKSAIFNAMNFAHPEAVLQKAEHEFKEGIVAEFEGVRDRLDVLEKHVFGPESQQVPVATAAAPVMTAEQVAAAMPPADVATANVTAVPETVAVDAEQHIDTSPASTEPAAPAA